MTELSFLRPFWLAGAVVCIIAMIFLYRRAYSRSNWWNLMDQHIARAVIIAKGSHKLLTPLNLLLTLISAMCVALAGPSFEKQVPDALQDKASVIVLLANGDSMYAGDITPNRNRAAKQKITALSQALPGSQFGLVAYAHSAHQVSPLTSDRKFLQLYLSQLEPKLMPDREFMTSGLHDALQLAKKMLQHARYPANVLIMADYLIESDTADIVAFKNELQVAVEVLAIGTENGGSLRFVASKYISQEPDTQMPLAQFAALKQQNVAMLGVTQNDNDIQWLVGEIKQSVAAANNLNPEFKWKDSGYLLAWIFIPACLLLFRHQCWLFSITPFIFVMASSFTPTTAAASTWDDLWWSADQLGQKAIKQGDYAKAAALFTDPYLKGWSLYQIADYQAAELQFRQVDSGDAFFYLANTLAMQQKYKAALGFYGQSIKLKGGFKAAENNVAIVKAMIAKANKVSANERNVEDAGQIMLQVAAKGKAKKKQHIHLDPLRYSEEELNVWLDKVKSSPEKLLKTKFELQSQEKMINAL